MLTVNLCWVTLCRLSFCSMSLSWVLLYITSLCWVSFMLGVSNECVYGECRYADCYNAECPIFIVMLTFIMQSVPFLLLFWLLLCSVTFYYCSTESHYADCHFAECQYVDCQNAQNHCDEWHFYLVLFMLDVIFPERGYGKCCYADCHNVTIY